MFYFMNNLHVPVLQCITKEKNSVCIISGHVMFLAYLIIVALVTISSFVTLLSQLYHALFICIHEDSPLDEQLVCSVVGVSTE